MQREISGKRLSCVAHSRAPLSHRHGFGKLFPVIMMCNDTKNNDVLYWWCCDSSIYRFVKMSRDRNHDVSIFRFVLLLERSWRNHVVAIHQCRFVNMWRDGNHVSIYRLVRLLALSWRSLNLITRWSCFVQCTCQLQSRDHGFVRHMYGQYIFGITDDLIAAQLLVEP